MREISFALNLAILLDITSERLCLGHEMALQRNHSRFALFHKVEEGEVLSGHVISMHRVSSDLQCLHKCLSCDKCLSFNLDASFYTCELNDVTRASSGHELEPRSGFSYYEPTGITSLPQQGAEPRVHPQQATPSLTSTQPLMTSSQASPSLSTLTSSATFTPSVSSLTTTTPPTVIDCGQNWHQYKTGCIRLFQEHKSRPAARARCQSFQTQSTGIKGNLIRIFSKEENDRVVSLATVQGKYYIGLGDQTEGVYKWVGGVVATYLNWMSGYPEASANEWNRDCAIIRILQSGDSGHGKWMTKQCRNSLRFICECPGRCT